MACNLKMRYFINTSTLNLCSGPHSESDVYRDPSAMAKLPAEPSLLMPIRRYFTWAKIYNFW